MIEGFIEVVGAMIVIVFDWCVTIIGGIIVLAIVGSLLKGCVEAWKELRDNRNILGVFALAWGVGWFFLFYDMATHRYGFWVMLLGNIGYGLVLPMIVFRIGDRLKRH